jgi:hypothetical protein
MVKSILNNLAESFSSGRVVPSLVISLGTYILFIVLTLLFGEYLWNHVLVKLVTVVKPIKSVWQLLGLMILFSLLFGA